MATTKNLTALQANLLRAYKKALTTDRVYRTQNDGRADGYTLGTVSAYEDSCRMAGFSHKELVEVVETTTKNVDEMLGRLDC